MEKMIRINLKNLNAKRRVNLSDMEKVAKRSLKALGEKNAEVNIVFVSNQKIRAMNRAYLGKDVSTDVIAWPSTDDSQFTIHNSRNFLGDIAISSDKAAQNSKIYGQKYAGELALYVIHGLLHLKGFEDKTANGRKAMRRKEDELAQQV